MDLIDPMLVTGITSDAILPHPNLANEREGKITIKC